MDEHKGNTLITNVTVVNSFSLSLLKYSKDQNQPDNVLNAQHRGRNLGFLIGILLRGLSYTFHGTLFFY